MICACSHRLLRIGLCGEERGKEKVRIQRRTKKKIEGEKKKVSNFPRQRKNVILREIKGGKERC